MDVPGEFFAFFLIEFGLQQQSYSFILSSRRRMRLYIHYEKGHNMILKNCMLFPPSGAKSINYLKIEQNVVNVYTVYT
ncbi:MAG: hypothetical protein M3299_12785, partial [Thermoproteota archaeon]|nr:hypothetical protein [Thermoproteota archaeon]